MVKARLSFLMVISMSEASAGMRSMAMGNSDGIKEIWLGTCIVVASTEGNCMVTASSSHLQGTDTMDRCKGTH